MSIGTRHCLSAGLVLLGSVSMANAVPMASWDFKAYGGFSRIDIGFNQDTVYDTALTGHGDYGLMTWSQADSHLNINDRIPDNSLPTNAGNFYNEASPIQPGVTSIHGETIGQIQTGDPMGEVAGWVTHYNFVGGGGSRGGRTAVNYHLQLFDPLTDQLIWNSGEMFFAMGLWDTRNQDDPCADGNPRDTPPNSVLYGCADRLRVGVLDDYNGSGVIDEADLLLADLGAGIEQSVASFAYGGDRYNVSLSGFWEVGPVLKGEAWTAENEVTHLEVRAQVQIPEPSTLALMALGVIGMTAGATRRREKKV